MNKRKGSHDLFTILNTDRSNLPGTHWWSILNIYPKKQLFSFIEQDNGNIKNKILYNTKKLKKKGNIVTLVMVTFLRKKL